MQERESRQQYLLRTNTRIALERTLKAASGATAGQTQRVSDVTDVGSVLGWTPKHKGAHAGSCVDEQESDVLLPPSQARKARQMALGAAHAKSRGRVANAVRRMARIKRVSSKALASVYSVSSGKSVPPSGERKSSRRALRGPATVAEPSPATTADARDGASISPATEQGGTGMLGAQAVASLVKRVVATKKAVRKVQGNVVGKRWRQRAEEVLDAATATGKCDAVRWACALDVPFRVGRRTYAFNGQIV